MLLEIIEQEKKAEEEETSRHILKSVHRAFREAFLTLPPEEYQWFELHSGGRRPGPGAQARQDADSGRPGAASLPAETVPPGAGSRADGGTPLPAGPAGATAERGEREFFQFPGPLHTALISPSSVVLRVNAERGFRCIARDKSRRPIEEGLDIRWRIAEGAGRLSPDSGEIVSFTAAPEPGLTVLLAEVRQGDILRTAEAVVTVTETLLEKAPGSGSGKGLPGYTYLRMPGELWRSRYDEKNNLVVINNGHKDYLFASRKPARKLKYICRLYGKELVLANFPGFESRELLERMIELSLYAEENLR
jgi:hypothetical protein